MQCMKIKQNNKWEALISLLGGGKEKKNDIGGEKRKEKKKIICMPAHVLNSRPPCFLLQYTNALS